MPDAKERRPESIRYRAVRTMRGAGLDEAVTDALGVAAQRRAAVSRRADQAALAAAVRDLWSHGRMNYVR